MQRTSLVPIALFSSVLLASATAADDNQRDPSLQARHLRAPGPQPGRPGPGGPPVVDIAAAIAELEKASGLAEAGAPGRHEGADRALRTDGLAERLHAIAARGRRAAARPYVHDLRPSRSGRPSPTPRPC